MSGFPPLITPNHANLEKIFCNDMGERISSSYEMVFCFGFLVFCFFQTTEG